MRMAAIILLSTMLPLNSYAAPLVDPNLPSVKPEIAPAANGQQGSATHHAGEPVALQRSMCMPVPDERLVTVARARGGTKSSKRNRSRSAIPARLIVRW